MKISRRFLLASAVVVSLGTAGIVTATAASADPVGSTPTVTTGTADLTAAPADTNDASSDVAVDDGEWTAEDDAQWMADANAESNDLAAYLTAHGIANTVTTDADGWVNVDYDANDQAANDAVDDFYWERYPMTQEDIDAYNSDAQGLVAYLTAHGVDATLVTDRHGLQTADYDSEDQAATDAVDDYYWQQSPMSQDDIAANNAEEQALADYLNANGVTATLVTDRHGLQYADYEWSDTVDELLSTYYGEDALPADAGTDTAIAVG